MTWFELQISCVKSDPLYKLCFNHCPKTFCLHLMLVLMTLSVFVIGAFISLNIIIISPIIATIKSRRRVFAVVVLTPFVFFVLATSWLLLSCKLFEDKSNEKVRFTQNEYEKNCFAGSFSEAERHVVDGATYGSHDVLWRRRTAFDCLHSHAARGGGFLHQTFTQFDWFY